MGNWKKKRSKKSYESSLFAVVLGGFLSLAGGWLSDRIKRSEDDDRVGAEKLEQVHGLLLRQRLWVRDTLNNAIRRTDSLPVLEAPGRLEIRSILGIYDPNHKGLIDEYEDALSRTTYFLNAHRLSKMGVMPIQRDDLFFTLDEMASTSALGIIGEIHRRRGLTVSREEDSCVKLISNTDEPFDIYTLRIHSREVLKSPY